MKNLSVFSLKLFFLIQASLRAAKEYLYSFIRFILTIIDSKMVTRELLSLADLTRAQTFCIHKLSEVIMGSENKNFVFAAF